MNFESMLNNSENQENKILKEEMIVMLGSELHNEWREPRKQEDGSYEPRVKTTKDEEWIKEKGKNEVDIANTSFENLPKDWQGENRIAAEIAIEELLKAVDINRELDEEFIEDASNIIHEKWLERNGEWASEEQKKPYAELSEEEKDKDRAQVKKAIEIFQEKR